MLAQIFGSNARVKILKSFLSKPEQKYYTRQLARDLDLQVNSVRRELENLQKIGLLKQEDAKESQESDKNLKNEKKYFIIDRNFLLFSELKSLFAKANLLSCQDFLKDTSEFGNIKHLWLSGLFTGDKLDVVNQKKICGSVFLFELSDGFCLDCLNNIINMYKSSTLKPTSPNVKWFLRIIDSLANKSGDYLASFSKITR